MTDPTTDNDPKTTLLTIGGMTCGGCVRRVHDALAGLQGVRNVAVHFARKEAVVTHDPSVLAADLVQAIGNAGYEASGAPPTADRHDRALPE